MSFNIINIIGYYFKESKTIELKRVYLYEHSKGEEEDMIEIAKNRNNLVYIYEGEGMFGINHKVVLKLNEDYFHYDEDEDEEDPKIRILESITEAKLIIRNPCGRNIEVDLHLLDDIIIDVLEC